MHVCKATIRQPTLWVNNPLVLAVRYIAVADVMNAQECKTLTATRMHDSCTCRSIVASIFQCVCLLNIRSIELDTYYHNIMVVCIH